MNYIKIIPIISKITVKAKQGIIKILIDLIFFIYFNHNQ